MSNVHFPGGSWLQAEPFIPDTSPSVRSQRADLKSAVLHHKSSESEAGRSRSTSWTSYV